MSKWKAHNKEIYYYWMVHDTFTCLIYQEMFFSKI